MTQKNIKKLSVKILEGKEDVVLPILGKVNDILASGDKDRVYELLYTVKCAVKMLENNPRELSSIACKELVTEDKATDILERLKRFKEQLQFLYNGMD